MDISLVITILTVLIALAVWIRTRTVGPVIVVTVLGFVATAFVTPSMAKGVTNGFNRIGAELLNEDLAHDSEPQDVGEAPTSWFEEISSPAPARSEAAPPPPWEWIGFIVAGVIALAVVILIVIWMFRRARALASKRAKAREAARQRQQRHAHHRQAWKQLLAQEKALGARVLQYEDDPELSLRYPVMRDHQDPKVAPVIEAMGRAKAYRTEEPPDLDVHPVESMFGKAVDALRIALTNAERYAKSTRWITFTPQERKKAQKALDLLNLAMNTAASRNERNLAYRQVARIMEELMMPLSPRALESIESSVGRLALAA